MSKVDNKDLTPSTLGKLRSNTLSPYFVVAFLLVFVEHLIGRFGSEGPGIGAMPFAWAYDHFAVASFIVPVGPWWCRSIVWLGSYFAVAFVLWRVLERRRSIVEPATWMRAALGWIGAELVFGLVMFVTHKLGLLNVD